MNKYEKLIKEANEAKLRYLTRRHFLLDCVTGLGAAALGSLLTSCGSSSKNILTDFAGNPMAPKAPHFPARAKSVIYLHMAGAPSQLELFDYKPALEKLHNQLCPPSLLEGKKFAFIQGVPKMLGPQAVFKQHGESRAWISDHLPTSPLWRMK